MTRYEFICLCVGVLIGAMTTQAWWIRVTWKLFFKIDKE